MLPAAVTRHEGSLVKPYVAREGPPMCNEFESRVSLKACGEDEGASDRDGLGPLLPDLLNGRRDVVAAVADDGGSSAMTSPAGGWKPRRSGDVREQHGHQHLVRFGCLLCGRFLQERDDLGENLPRGGGG